MDPQLKIYSTTWCGDCKRTKAWLNDHGIAYAEVNIESNPDALTFVQKINNGLMTTPTIVFSDGSVLVEPSNEDLRQKLESLKVI